MARWARVIFLPCGGDEVPSLIDTNNTAPKFTPSKLTELVLRPQLAIAGVKLGMTMEQVVATWGRPRWVTQYFNRTPVLRYSDSVEAWDSYARTSVFFRPGSNSVMVIWVVFDWPRGKPWLSPKVDECFRVLGEPAARGYVPDPLKPPKQPPKHWYCRMVYKLPPLVLYFADGQLMALEVNPEAKGVAPEGKGSDDYSIPFCLE